VDGQPKICAAAFRQFTRLRDRHDGRVGGAGNIERGKVKGIARIIRNQHLDEILIRIAEMEKRYVQSSRNLIDHRVGKRKAILWVRWVRVGGWNEDGPRGERCASIGGSPEAQFACCGLKAGPRYVNIITVLVAWVGADGKPLLIASIVFLNDDAGAPGIPSVGRLVHLNRSVDSIGS
jgi:hypothetical protein